MSYQLPANAAAGKERGCPKCGAAPLHPCVNTRNGQPRQTTHQERKPKAAQS